MSPAGRASVNPQGCVGTLFQLGRDAAGPADARYWDDVEARSRRECRPAEGEDAVIAAEIETDRLRLTPVGEADFADLCRLTAHPEVGGKLKHGVLTEAETRAQLDTYRATWESRGYGVFVMRRREDGAFVGIVGLWDHDEGVGVAMRYAVMPEHRARGYTKEAAMSVLQFADRQNIHPVMAVTRENNLVSRQILVDLGFALREIRDTGHARVAIFALASGGPA